MICSLWCHISCNADKVRKFTASIAEDEKLIAKFKKDESEKLKVCKMICLKLENSSLCVCVCIEHRGFRSSDWRAEGEEGENQERYGWTGVGTYIPHDWYVHELCFVMCVCQELTMREVRKMQANYIKDITQIQKKIGTLVSRFALHSYYSV